MKLLFDIDDTITNETEFMLKYASGYLKKKFGIDFSVSNPYGYDVSEVFGIRDYLEKNNYSLENLENELKKINIEFWNKFFVKYIFYPIKKDVAKTTKYFS